MGIFDAILEIIRAKTRKKEPSEKCPNCGRSRKNDFPVCFCPKHQIMFRNMNPKKRQRISRKIKKKFNAGKIDPLLKCPYIKNNGKVCRIPVTPKPAKGYMCTHCGYYEPP